MLEIIDLSAGYPHQQVLRHVSACIPAASLTVILGPNGCGKSTLLKTIGGLIPASGGRIVLDEEDLTCMPPAQRARRMAYLAQSRQIPEITALRLVLHGRFPYLSYPRRYRAQDEAIAREAMEQMGVSELADRNVKELSGGQRQKVYIAMALAQETPVILLDEPTTYLDIRRQLQLMQQAHALARQGKTVVMILHDLPHALETADHILLMEEGRLVMQGAPEEVYASGELNRVFGVRVNRLATERSYQYYCEVE